MQFTSKRKGRGIIPALGSLALLLTGCTMPSSATDKQVELSFTYATSNNLESPFEVLAEKYMEANSHVNITLNPQPNDQYGRSIRAQLQAGNAADIIQTTPGRGDSTSLLPLAESGFLAPLGKLAKDHVPEGSELTFELDGDVYGQAMGVSATGLSVNTTALKASGVGEFPADFEALLENCQTVASDGRSLVALAGAAAPNVNMTAMSIAATRVYADTPDWNKLRLEGKVSFADSDGWRQTFDDIVAMKEAACFQGGAEGAGFDVLTGNLSSGSSVTAVIPGGNIREIAKVAQGQDFDVRAFPPHAGDAPYILAYPSYALSLNAAADNPDEAMEFLEWVAGSEAISLYSEITETLPTGPLDEFQFGGTVYAPVADLIRDGQYTSLPNQTWPNPAVSDALQSGVQGLLTGQITPSEALTALDHAWDK